MANFVRNVLIDGVKYAVGDKRIEGDNFAYIQVPEAITVGTNLTDLTPIQKALDSTDGSLLYVPSLNTFFAPTASSTPATTRIWASTTGDKGYQLKATLNASGVLQSAVINEGGECINYISLMEDIVPVSSAGTPIYTPVTTPEGIALGKKIEEKKNKPIFIEADGMMMPASLFVGYANKNAAGQRYEEYYVEHVGLAQFYYDSFYIRVYYNDSWEVIGSAVGSLKISQTEWKTLYEATQSLVDKSYVETDLAKEIGTLLKVYGNQMDTNIAGPGGVPVYMKDGKPWNVPNNIMYTLKSINSKSGYPIHDDVEIWTYTPNYYNENYKIGDSTNSYSVCDIKVYLTASGLNVLGLSIGGHDEEFVRISKKYMEIEVDTPEDFLKANVTGDTLNLFSVQPAAASKIIHYPESVLFTSDAAFELKFAPNEDMGSDPYTPDAVIEISKDGLNWTQPTWDENNGILLKADTLNSELGKYSVFIKSDNHINTNDGSYSSAFSTVSGSNIEVSGILDALWGGKPMIDFECFGLFMSNTGITKTHNLIMPATQLTADCYESMFQDCTSLTTTPTLPATTLAYCCYAGMFIGCTALTTPPELPATTLAEACYSNMFVGCTVITTPPALPAITLDTSCYENMFEGCAALTIAPTLPATTLTERCYMNMFLDCASLIVPPELPATILAEACYDEMFKGCTSLTQAPELPATVLAKYCYSHMFEDCKALTKPVVFPEITTLAETCMNAMFKNCEGIKWAASGTPYIIKTTDGSTATTYTIAMFLGNTGAIPETPSGTPKLNTTYYLAV